MALLFCEIILLGLGNIEFQDVNPTATEQPQCPEILQETCLKNSLPILEELKATNVSQCCAACVAMEACVSWTLNTQQNTCHLRATFKTKSNGRECTSGHVPSHKPVPPTPRPPAPPGAKNVLLIIVDDLRPQLGAYNISVCNGMKMHTPNIDKLASRGLTFRNAYNQYAVCSPSRNSFMSGRRPDTTLTYNFKDSFRTAPGGESMVALPEYFKTHGYNTTGCGKTYHSGHPKNFDQPRSWTTGVPYVGYNQGLGFCNHHCACTISAPKYRSDEQYAARAIELMTSHRANDIGPWFVAVGFIRPHVDWSSPQEFWDLYPEDKCKDDVAKHPTAPPTAPKVAWVDGGYVDGSCGRKDVGPNYHFNASIPVNNSVASNWRRGYYAAVSYMDSNVGKVLDALESLGYANDTVVALMADHGYQLGEHSMWEKYTNWELAARVPTMLAVPWKPKSHGVVTSALVENVDMYATLASASGLPVPDIACDGCIEGDDNTPLLDDPHRTWKKAAFSQYGRCGLNDATGFYHRCSGDPREAIQVMGYSVRTADYRYTEWFAYNGSVADFNKTVARELYDHTTDMGDDFDAYDQVNIADDPAHAQTVAQHAAIVREGWKKQRPDV